MDYMPIFSGRVIESPKVTEQVLYDFRALLDHMLSEHYYGTMQRKINECGVKVYAEAQGGPVPSHAMNFVDIPMNEFWNPDASPRMRNIRLTSSQADLRGKQIVAAEAFSSKPEDGRWQNYPGKMKKPGDLAYIGGINRFCFHTYAHQPVDYAPGFALGRYGTIFSRLSTWWDYSAAWIEYLSRCQYMLQQGIKAADVTFLFHYDIRYAYNSKYTKLPEGYDYRIAYPEDLEKAEVIDGRIVFPNGGSSSILIIVPSPGMDRATLETVRRLVVDGATVCGVPPVFQSSRSESMKDAGKEEFGSIIRELWPEGSAKSVNRLGKGKVLCGYSNAEAISYLGIGKDADLGTKGLHFLHKKAGKNDLYFISNQKAEQVSSTAGFRTDKRYCSIWNPVTGEVFAVDSKKDGTVMKVAIELPEFGSQFLLFTDYPVTDNRMKKKAPAGEIKIRQDWRVTFEDTKQYDGELSVSGEFESIDKSENPEIRYYSGTIRYENDFKVNKKQIDKSGKSVVVTFDEIHDICEVLVNGENAGVLWTRPYSLDITDFLKDGENTITVRVANSWINRIIGDEQLEPDLKYEMNGTKFTSGRLAAFPEWFYEDMPEDRQRMTFYTWKHYDRNSPLVPSGLEGRVRLEMCE